MWRGNLAIHFCESDLHRLGVLARSAYPDEACGALVGQRQPEGHSVLSVRPIPNLSPSARDAFEMDIEQMLKIEHEARHSGLELIGFWHTHPNGLACPSERDASYAWNGYSYTIIGVSDCGAIEVKSWRPAHGEFQREPLV